MYLTTGSKEYIMESCPQIEKKVIIRLKVDHSYLNLLIYKINGTDLCTHCFYLRTFYKYYMLIPNTNNQTCDY